MYTVPSPSTPRRLLSVSCPKTATRTDHAEGWDEIQAFQTVKSAAVFSTEEFVRVRARTRRENICGRREERARGLSSGEPVAGWALAPGVIGSGQAHLGPAGA